ncbi:alpha/beta hydrolase [Streptomyces millisiae]|uniref:alpha/beta hydrolase n=1 Tax=Streptomyces millisiae TaxID=3075542 RepID=UPI00288B5260|nr:alpha/beta hydrolase [Streptomyces sp. DSM 44918]
MVFVVLVTAGWLSSRAEPPPDVFEQEVSAWERGHVAGEPLPEPDASPDRVADFFAGLTVAQQRRLAERYPLVVGNLSGAPVQLRYEANRHALAEAVAAERARMTDERLSPAGQQEAGRRMHRFESMLAEGRQILSFDPTGRGRAAEVMGDLETADRISVVVPGVDSGLLNFERTARRYSAPVGMAEALYEEERAIGGASTAVIAWADYDSPPTIAMSAATAELATAGADRLVDAVGALPGEAPVALFCHSYGSVVCGVAAAELPGRVSDIAVAGSPGMRASGVADLDTSARVWAIRADDDWIEDVPHMEIGPIGFGQDPVTPAFGARLLDAGDAEGHSGYFSPGEASLTNLARIGAGVVDDVTCAPGVRSCAPVDPCAAHAT